MCIRDSLIIIATVTSVQRVWFCDCDRVRARFHQVHVMTVNATAKLLLTLRPSQHARLLGLRVSLYILLSSKSTFVVYYLSLEVDNDTHFTDAQRREG